MDELLSVPDIARRWGVSETVVRRAVKRGDLLPAKVEIRGKQTLRFFRSSDVDALRPGRAEQS